MARRDANAELVTFLSGRRVDIGATLRALPADVDIELAALAVRELMRTSVFEHHCRSLPAAVIRAVLALPIAGTTHAFLRLAVPEATPTEWRRALAALRVLADPADAPIRALATDAHVLAAIQGAVATATDEVPLAMLVVLVVDGGAASLDALVPHVDASTRDDLRLERLTRLRPHARRTPELDALFVELEATRDERGTAGQRLALGPRIGIGSVNPLWFRAWLVGRTTAGYQIHARVEVDSRKPNWFSVQVSGKTYTSFDAAGEHTDRLKLGRCDIEEVPSWLERAAARLRLVSHNGRF